MSYRGRPSKGCESCRARKVKCDEASPVCGRCSKSGHDCKYRDQADLLFRNQTASAAQKAEESWRKRSKSHQRRDISEGSTSNNTPPSDKSSPYEPLNEPPYHVSDVNTSIVHFDELTIAPRVKPDILRLAYDRFIYDFVLPKSPNRPPDQPSDALFSFIPILYENAAEDSCLATVVNAVAYVNFANRCNAPQAEALAEECLGKGITMLSKVIADKILAGTNDTLCSVYLMGIYENLTIQQRQGTFIAHHHGANALLQLRSIKQYYSDSVSARLYEVAYAQMLLGNIQAGKRPPLPMRDDVSAEENSPNLYNNADFFIIRLIWKEAMLHARWQEVKQSPHPPINRSNLQELLHGALHLDSEFQAWETAIPPTWRYRIDPNTPENRATFDERWQKLILLSRGAPEDIHSYSTLKQYWMWSFYRTSRIFLLRDQLEILNWMFRLPEPDPLIVQTDASQKESEPTTTPSKPTIMGLDNMTLRNLHSSATISMIKMIEESCAAILSSFTVPIYSKTIEDVVGMRGYVCLWSLGTMDSVLAAGLVPESMAPNTGDYSQMSPFSQTASFASQAPVAYSTAPHSMQSAEQSPYGTNPQFPEPSNLLPPEHHYSSPSISTSQDASHFTPPAAPPTFDPTATTGHIFNDSPAHPYDLPVDLSALDINDTPKQLDVAAKREWLNSLLYYIGTELGIKKALCVPIVEGFMPKVKPRVDEIFCR
ncbi:uncharacterized protein K460DRAFT_300146 [Cucurbitaria berberidis CBS 394.84]|uniref:Zn(2)-C6 fungal-type domain-containing protein n=1 Tax=Cucurbitaria berberidis CBS 394.84 TaxID=1168544 RepID=A0A9P4LCW4_9PLEO|nr:uncharacterized protein K460DRAFT_300146 [Cucurbitaria berberidis CBS 394.84]KAF1849787.1 hypothetical protein K460DRAFT_300146 [Cucurbitaria berberidis CBS 394.84]